MTELRVISPDDWALWRDLRLAALAEAPEAFGSKLADWVDADESRWRDRLSGPGLHNLLVFLDGVPVGMASGHPGDTGVPELISMYVAPAGRGHGVGNLLIDAITTWAEAQGAAALLLNVVATNDRAIALYRRNGFVDNGPGTDPGEPGDPVEVSMIRPLPARTPASR